MTDFRTRAACRGADVELFYPLGRPGSPGFERLARPARELCRACPVALECLRGALAEGDDVAIRGGTDPAQRRALRALVIVPVPTVAPAPKPKRASPRKAA